VKRATLILALPVATVVLYVFFVEPLWVVPLLEKMTPNILYRVKTKEPVVALSFDDGPNAEFTPQVLELLKENDAKATFFLIGERAERHPELVRRILAEGNEVGNHWCRDGSVLLQSDEKFLEGLERTERAIEQAPTPEGPTPKMAPFLLEDSSKGRRYTGLELGKDPGSPTGSGQALSESGARSEEKTRTLKTEACGTRSKTEELDQPCLQRFFRPPGGVARPGELRLAKEHGYTSVLGCAYPHDPMKTPVWYQRWLIEKNLAPGTIVILHDGIKDPTRSVETLRQILEEGKRRGFKFVSIGELVEKSDGEAGKE